MVTSVAQGTELSQRMEKRFQQADDRARRGAADLRLVAGTASLGAWKNSSNLSEDN